MPSYLPPFSDVYKRQAQYCAFFSDQKWGARENYDLLVNTTGKDIKKVTAAIAGYLEHLEG